MIWLDLQHSHFKTQELPLARIKKIMKLDEDVKVSLLRAPTEIVIHDAVKQEYVFIGDYRGTL